ncbi:MAG TPA: hypothetical protein VHU84_01345 [Lacipirellulaceae bacterium]|jgi:heme exporter protein D|nr:hypothetical protein [Lacipirellulaceae bacterium]
MIRTPLAIPEIAIIAGTRAALGAGIGFLLADRLNTDQRRAVGWTLFAVGAITTVPIVIQLLESRREIANDEEHRSVRRARQREYAS